MYLKTTLVKFQTGQHILEHSVVVIFGETLLREIFQS